MSKAILGSILDRFSRFSTKWKIFVWKFSIRSRFSNSSGDVAMTTNFVAKLPTLLHFSL